MFTHCTRIALALFCCIAPVALAAPRKKVERRIVLDVIVDAPIEDVYRAWTTTEGTSKFLAPKTVVGTRVGDEYVAIFDPVNDPEGLITGTRGARLLAVVPPRHVAFEWIPFIGVDMKRPDAPPFAPPEVRDERPIPTWVEIDLERHGSSTRVTLSHHGFPPGELWDRTLTYNRDRAWPMVLKRLATSFQHPRADMP